MRALPLLTIVLATVAAVAGCQSDATAPLVVQADPQALTVVPIAATINGGKLLKLTATVHHEDGSTSSPSDVTWYSSDGAIASVASDGVVQGLRLGRVQIVATWHDSRGSSLVTVLEPVNKKQPPCPEPLKPTSGLVIPSQAGCA